MEEFITGHPQTTAVLFAATLALLVWIGKRALDNNTNAFERLNSTITTLIDRIHVVETKQSTMEARCEERVKRWEIQ